jgi:hypothetical protein
VHETIIKSGWDTLLVAIPFLVILFIGFFRLDGMLARKKKAGSRASRPPSGLDEDGAPIICDPDGRPWRKPNSRE